MYPINANVVRLAEYQAWFAQQGLVEGQDYTFSDTVPGWVQVNFQRLEDLDRFAVYGSTLTY